jgi:hypothetical protein
LIWQLSQLRKVGVTLFAMPKRLGRFDIGHKRRPLRANRRAPLEAIDRAWPISMTELAAISMLANSIEKLWAIKRNHL